MPKDISPLSQHGYRVLLVDDNPHFLTVAYEFLEEHDGIEVVGAVSSGHEALHVVDHLSPGLVIVDISMDGMNGLELTRLLKSSGHVAVIVLTLLDTPSYQQAAFEAGADAFVGKSRMDVDLLPAIRRLIDDGCRAVSP
ncbi:MAG: hypothetical protein Kow00124_32270 [Anaerolineae bacterium]